MVAMSILHLAQMRLENLVKDNTCHSEVRQEIVEAIQFLEGSLARLDGRNPYRLDPDNFSLITDTKIRLTVTEYNILEILIANAGRLTPFEDITLPVWGGDTKRARGSLKAYIKRLRTKIGDSAIASIKEKGYMIVP